MIVKLAKNTAAALFLFFVFAFFYHAITMQY